MKQIILQKGQIYIDQVPAPLPKKDKLLVRLIKSCISSGTEISGIKNSAEPLWKRAIKHPEKVKKAIDNVKAYGVQDTIDKGKLGINSQFPLGYSASGVVIDNGGSQYFDIGDKVSVGGNQCAFHAEIVSVPVNLATKIPEDLDLEQASVATIGAIALQGVRRLGPTIGETFVIVGMGVLGQITGQLLLANGCNAIAYDLDEERVDLAKTFGMEPVYKSLVADLGGHISCMTDGYGADGVIICASTGSNSVISDSFKMCRKKGRVVIVGDIGLDINREDFYKKEIDLFISTSYGPGRYDYEYEEKGLEYPLPYVRWTENRNMSAFLSLLSNNKIDVKSLIGFRKRIGQAEEAYADLSAGVMLGILEYENDQEIDNKIVLQAEKFDRARLLGVSLIGAGSFAQSNHLPNLIKIKDKFRIQGIAGRTGYKLKEVAERFGASFVSTDFKDIITDDNTDAIVISTRHDSHAQYVIESLRNKKHVFVEKPTVIRPQELVDVMEVCANDENVMLMTAYNRRFSTLMVRIKEIIKKRSGPMMILYKMNAGFLPKDIWVHGEEGGGRNIGEACHIYDLFTFLTGSTFCSVKASSITKTNESYMKNDNFSVIVTFEDGTAATLLYTALGANEVPKERMEIYFDGKVLLMDDYKKLEIKGAKISGISNSRQNKGVQECLEKFCNTIAVGGECPIPLWQQKQAMEIAFEVEKQIMGASYTQ